MSIQKTRLSKFIRKTFVYGLSSWLQSWRTVSISLLSLLIGYYLVSNLIVYYLDVYNQKIFIAVVMLFTVEVLIRARSRVKSENWPLKWLAIDNFRIGAVYAVVLEAYKLGS